MEQSAALAGMTPESETSGLSQQKGLLDDTGKVMSQTPMEKMEHRLLRQFETRQARVCVIGLGYVGLPLVEALHTAGYSVVGFDIDPKKIQRLAEGESYIGRVPSSRVVSMLDSGRFQPTCQAAHFREVDAIIICVPTPLTEAREPDLSFITGTATSIRHYLREGQLIILESTTYPGTTREVLCPILELSGLKAGQDFFVAFSPEREDPGNSQHTTSSIPKVVGGIDAVSSRLAAALYRPVVSGVVPVSTAETAEACKILENTYRAVNIALVNELKVVFDRMGIDIWEVIAAAKTKPFGFQPFYPGPGLGGHCIPIDPFYLTWAARKFGLHTRFIELAGEINTGMPQYVVQRVAQTLNDESKPVRGSNICILGVAYKKNVEDPRESPAFEIIELLLQQGAKVSYNDPHVPIIPPMRRHHLQMESTPLTEEYLRSQDCVVIVTDHSAYDWTMITRHARLIVDTRNATEQVRDPQCRIVKA